MRDKKEQTVVFVAPSLQLGGLENAASTMANYLSTRVKKLHFITLYNFPHFFKLNESITVIDPPLDKKKENKLVYYLKIVLFLRKQLRLLKPDVVVAYGDWSNILVLMAGIGLKTRIFISDRASPGLTFQWHVAFLRKILYKRAYGVIAQTDRAAQQKREMLGKNINVKVISNPVKEVRLFPEIVRKNCILSVGRHWYVKGFDRLIEAFSLLADKDFTLIIAGSNGPETQNIKALITKFNLTKKVELINNVKEVDRLAAECKIFVLPSRSEGMPNALLESMAAGLACISFDINAGPREIITKGVDGILVEDGNVEELAKQMEFLISNPDEIARLGNNALKIRDRLSIDKIGQQFLDFICS